MKKLTFSIITLGTIMLSAFTKGDMQQSKTPVHSNSPKLAAVSINNDHFGNKHQNGNKANLSQADIGE